MTIIPEFFKNISRFDNVIFLFTEYGDWTMIAGLISALTALALDVFLLYFVIWVNCLKNVLFIIISKNTSC